MSCIGLDLSEPKIEDPYTQESAILFTLFNEG